MTLKTYQGTGQSHTGSSGFTNHFGSASPEKLAKLHEQMKAELGEHVIVNGEDNVCSPLNTRPEYFGHHFFRATGRTVLAYYHTGISGVTKSGIVLAPEDFDAMTEWYATEYGMAMTDNRALKLTFNSTAL